MKKVCILTLMLLFTMALYVKNAVALNLPVSEGYGQDWLAPEGVLKVDPEGYHTPVGKVNGDPSILPEKQLEETTIFITVMNA